jgi:hypothetical protein
MIAADASYPAGVGDTMLPQPGGFLHILIAARQRTR